MNPDYKNVIVDKIILILGDDTINLSAVMVFRKVNKPISDFVEMTHSEWLVSSFQTVHGPGYVQGTPQ